MPAGSELYKKGMAKRRQLMGDAAVEAGAKGVYADPVMQKFLGIENPCAGQVFSNTVLTGTGVISRANYRKLGVECEIVVEIGKDIEPQRRCNTRRSYA